MNNIEKELAKESDEIVFGTNDPAEIQESLKKEQTRLEKLESTVGGYLKQYRRLRGLRVPEMAERAKVPATTWRAWESNIETPSESEIAALARDLHLIDIQLEKLQELRKKSPLVALRRIVQFRPELLAAFGVGAVHTSFEWQALPQVMRDKLVQWGQANGYHLPEDLPSLVESFETPEAAEAWVNEVWPEPRAADE